MFLIYVVCHILLLYCTFQYFPLFIIDTEAKQRALGGESLREDMLISNQVLTCPRISELKPDSPRPMAMHSANSRI